MTTTRTESLQIANTIASQIALGVKMSLGLRNGVALERGVRYHAGPGARRFYVEITLNYLDLYDVRVYRLRRGDNVQVVTFDADDVYAEDLGRTLLTAESESWG